MSTIAAHEHSDDEFTDIEGSVGAVEYDFISANHCGTVLSGLNSLRTRQLLFDVTLIVDGSRFRAHKVVLASCSEYFRAMFTGEMKEQLQSEIQLNAMSPVGVQLLVDYAYTSKLTLNKENILVVLGAASHLQMFPIVDACARFLYSQIDVDNCVDILTLSEMYSLTQLCEKSYLYIARRLDQLSCTYVFQQLTGQQLCRLLDKQYPVDCTELEVMRAVLSWTHYDLLAEDRRQWVVEIMALVNYSIIPADDLRELRQWSVYCEVVKSLPQVAELLYSRLRVGNGGRLSQVPPGLKNTRGFEAAVVNVGGFQASVGMTNALMYSYGGGDVWKHLVNTPAQDMSGFGVTVLSNDIYVVGGCFNSAMEDDVHPLGYRYNVWTNEWTAIAPMGHERMNFYLGACNDRLYAVGGEGDEGGDVGVLECEQYDPHNNSWSVKCSIPRARQQHAGCTVGDHVYITGGLNWTVVCNSLFVYDTLSDRWSIKSAMMTSRADHCMTQHNSCLYVAGGWNEDTNNNNQRTIHSTIEIYDITHDQWTVLTRVPTARYLSSMVCMRDQLYIIGGFKSLRQQKTSKKIEVYNLDEQQWQRHADYPVTLWEHESCVIHVPLYRHDL